MLGVCMTGGSFGSAVDKKTKNELFECHVLGVYWCMYVVARLAWQ